jgi:hypothetical protein
MDMSAFEFISVLLSIVVGLAFTRVLSGVARALEIRRRIRFYWVQGVWTANVALLLVVFWWAVLFSHADSEVWLFPSFALLLVYSVLIFLQAALILPSDLGEGADLEAHFFEVRPWFFSLLALTTVAEFGDTLLHGGFERVVAFGPGYWIILVSGVTLSTVGARSANRRFHEFYSILFFLGMSIWVVRRFGAIG